MGTGLEAREVIRPDYNIRAALDTKGYANLPITLGRPAVEELFENFKAFAALCEEPKGERLADAVNYETGDKGNGVFYLQRRKPGDINVREKRGTVGTDNKLVMHFGALTHARALSALNGSMPEEMRDFLDNCAQFYIEGRRAGLLGARALGVDRPLFPANLNKDIHLLRLIDYIATDSDQLGAAHFDRSVTTLAISESAPGLRGAPGDNGFLEPLDEEVADRLRQGLDPIDHQEGIAKFFAAAGLRRLPVSTRQSQGLDEVPLLAHDIVNENPGENRQAVVMFFNPHLGFEPYTVPSKEETGVSY
jgi:hypothetical protein